MIVTIPKQYTNLYICGDIHGEFKSLVFKLQQYRITNSVIVVAGDCGFGFEKPQHYANMHNRLCKKLAKLGCLILFVRGNHDDPEYFNGSLKIDYKYMKTLSDYDVIQFNDANILCVGGGTSIDRSYRQSVMRKNGWRGNAKPLWWEGESVDTNHHEALLGVDCKCEITHVISHVAPRLSSGMWPQVVYDYCKQDEELESDLIAEANNIECLWNDLTSHFKYKIITWYHGHYHKSSVIPSKDGTKFYSLDILQLVELKLALLSTQNNPDSN